MMKKVMLILVVLCLVGVTQADLTATVDPAATWYGYMNVFETPANGGGYLWGSAWGTGDLRATFGTDLLLQANTNAWNAEDAYWVDPVSGLGNKVMEAAFYQEFGTGYDGQSITFDYEVLANNLAAAGYATQGFIKTLNPAAGWSVVDIDIADLTVGAQSLNLTVSANPDLVLQVGFVVTGLNVDPASAEALLGVNIATIPEPATLALLGLGGLLLRRKK